MRNNPIVPRTITCKTSQSNRRRPSGRPPRNWYVGVVKGGHTMSPRLQVAWNEIQAARQYTLRLLDDLTQDEWFRMPQPSVTHIGWQIGHLAMAEYRLALERIRGVQAD